VGITCHSGTPARDTAEAAGNPVAERDARMAMTAARMRALFREVIPSCIVPRILGELAIGLPDPMG
jgi:hypothetical protein